MSEFNLIDEPWIPCIDLNGQPVEYGIRNTFAKAHELREICDDSPLVTVAIHRLLLAILYRAFQGPTGMKEWRKLYQVGSFSVDGKLGDYLNKWRNRFFLFDEKYPFMQVAELDLNDYKENGEIKKDKSDGIMRLAREAPDKGGRILFDHRVGTERPDYEPKQIAKMLLAAQSYSGTGVASGGKIGTQKISPTPCQFAPCVDGLCLYLQGENLFQTLLLNLVPTDLPSNDLPAWEDDNIASTAIRSWSKSFVLSGRVQRYAPLSRFVRLLDKRSIFFTNGLKPDADSGDPMKIYRREDMKKRFEPIKLSEKKAAWRDAHALFSYIITDRQKPAACLNHAARLSDLHSLANIVGFARDQNKILLWRHERMPVPAALLSEDNLIERLGGLIQNAENAAIELNNRMRRIAKLSLSPSAETPDGRQPDKDDVARLIEAIDPRPVYWSRLEQHFYTLLENLPGDWDLASGDWKEDDRQTATNTWREQVKREARCALEESIRSLGTTSRAIQAVARVRTDFNDGDLKPKNRKSKNRKGGRKQNES